MPLIHRLAIAAALALLPASASAVGIGKTCGGFIGIACDDGLFCDPPANRCGSADLTGTCVRAGTVCTMIYQPVCGCDGKTYGNDCQRRAARVAKNHDGRC